MCTCVYDFMSYNIPQGSVLGPVLFILHINAVCEQDIGGKIVTYADDTCLLSSGKSWEGMYLKPTKGLNLTYIYISELDLTLNSNKTTYMKLSTNKISNDDCSLIINNYSLIN